MENPLSVSASMPKRRFDLIDEQGFHRRLGRTNGQHHTLPRRRLTVFPELSLVAVQYSVGNILLSGRQTLTEIH